MASESTSLSKIVQRPLVESVYFNCNSRSVMPDLRSSMIFFPLICLFCLIGPPIASDIGRRNSDPGSIFMTDLTLVLNLDLAFLVPNTSEFLCQSNYTVQLGSCVDQKAWPSIDNHCWIAPSSGVNYPKTGRSNNGCQ